MIQVFSILSKNEKTPEHLPGLLGLHLFRRLLQNFSVLHSFYGPLYDLIIFCDLSILQDLIAPYKLRDLYELIYSAKNFSRTSSTGIFCPVNSSKAAAPCQRSIPIPPVAARQPASFAFLTSSVSLGL